MPQRLAMPALELEWFDRLAPLEGEWSALAEQAGNLFATYEFAQNWWAARGEDRPLLIAVCRREGTAVGLIPLYLWRTWPRIARFVGHGAGDQLGPICPPEEATAVAAALSDALRHASISLLIGEQLPAGVWSSLAGARVISREGSPVLPLAGQTWQSFLQGLSSNLRGQIGRYERRLAKSAELAYRLTSSPDELPRDLDTLFALHRARWPEGTNFARNENLHRTFAGIALERGWLRLWLLELDGVPRAAWLGYRYGGAEWYYQAGRDPELERLSVGFVLLCHTIRAAIESGATEYRLLRGGEEYKYRFASSDPGLETIGFPRGPAGNAALGLAIGARAGRRLLGRLPAIARR